MISRPQLPVIPQPLHNEEGTLRALVAQMLMDADRESMTTSVPTPTLVLILETLHGKLGPQAPRPAVAEQPGSLVETSENPNLVHWIRRAAREIEDAEDDGVPRPLPPLDSR